MKRARAEWDFPYEPVSTGAARAARAQFDIVVATGSPVEGVTLQRALAAIAPDCTIEPLLNRAPLHWSRIRASAMVTLGQVLDELRIAKIDARYATWARSGSMALAPAMDWSRADRARPLDWPPVPERASSGPAAVGARWFLGEAGGVTVDRMLCGTGAGTRLAVVDDDTADFEHLDLNRVVCVGTDRPAAGTGHAALMVGWAVGARRPDGSSFEGVAPDASVRVYCIAKAGVDVVGLPLAIARAVFDGADVVVCATYVEGTSSPLLDDALEVASRLGRRGRGTIVLLPTGRETSSPGGSIHASLSLGLGDPASDSRVHCVAPGGRQGGWFLWRSPSGKVRPFSNRGPAVRWLAPGDDMAHPFSGRDRFFHAESSGASAIAAGVVSLVLARNPLLKACDVHTLLLRTVSPAAAEELSPSLADPADVLPLGKDQDGHNAKLGYGRLNAALACCAADDPVALELVAMGDHGAAIAWCQGVPKPYSVRLSQWSVRKLLSRPDLEHAARVVLRHARLTVGEPGRSAAHDPGALVRHIAIVVRELARARSMPRDLRLELAGAFAALTDQSSTDRHPGGLLEAAILERLARAWSVSPGAQREPETEAFSAPAIRA